MSDPTTGGISGNTADAGVIDDIEMNAGFYESALAEPERPIVVQAYRTFRSALMNTTAIQTISRRG